MIYDLVHRVRYAMLDAILSETKAKQNEFFPLMSELRLFNPACVYKDTLGYFMLL